MQLRTTHLHMPASLQREPSEPASSQPEDVVATAFAAGDERRALLLRVLEHDSFSVSELANLFGMAQPALSHHLKILREAGLLAARREANSIYYRRRINPHAPLALAVFDALDRQPMNASLLKKIDELHSERERQVERFFANNADALRSQQKLISETAVYAPSLRELWRSTASPDAQALEVGPGDGAILSLLAEDFGHATAVDQAEAMLAPVHARVSGFKNVLLLHREFTRFRTRTRFDAVVAAMVLHHLPAPRQFFAQAARLLASQGRLLIAELERHEHDWVRDACGDLWLGFDSNELDHWAGSAGLVSGPRQFLAQKNGFSIQILTYIKEQA